MRTSKLRNKHAQKISCNKVVMASLKLLCVDADLDKEYTRYNTFVTIPSCTYLTFFFQKRSEKAAWFCEGGMQ